MYYITLHYIILYTYSIVSYHIICSSGVECGLVKPVPMGVLTKVIFPKEISSNHLPHSTPDSNHFVFLSHLHPKINNQCCSGRKELLVLPLKPHSVTPEAGPARLGEPIRVQGPDKRPLYEEGNPLPMSFVDLTFILPCSIPNSHSHQQTAICEVG